MDRRARAPVMELFGGAALLSLPLLVSLPLLAWLPGCVAAPKREGVGGYCSRDEQCLQGLTCIDRQCREWSSARDGGGIEPVDAGDGGGMEAADAGDGGLDGGASLVDSGVDGGPRDAGLDLDADAPFVDAGGGARGRP